MIPQTIGQVLSTINLIPMSDITTTTTGTGVDCQQFDGEAAFILCAKNVAGTTPTLNVKLQTSANNSSGWGDITGATFTQVTGANTKAAVMQKIAVKLGDCDRYVRAVATVAGTDSPEFLISLVGLGVTQIR